MEYLDIDSWKRREHFYNYLHFSQPFFNITAPLEIRPLKDFAADNKISFFLSYYYVALRAINHIDELRYRIRDDQVVVHPTIHGGCAVINPDETFSFAYFDYSADFQSYLEGASSALASLKEQPSLDPQFHRDDLIHSSVIPWISFTNFEHAKRFGKGDSTPKVVFGKYFEQGKGLLMPISLAVHHALADGIHVGKFFQHMESSIKKGDWY